MKAWEAELFLPGPQAGRDGAASAGHRGNSVQTSHLLPLRPLIALASLPSPDLHCGLHRPPVHKILVSQCPVCNLVVPGLGQAIAGGQAHPSPKALLPVEVHEGLFPHLGEYWHWWEWGCGGSATQASGSRMLGWVGGARAYTTVGPGEESGFVLAVISQGWENVRVWRSSVGTHTYPTGVTPQRPGRG